MTRANRAEPPRREMLVTEEALLLAQPRVLQNQLRLAARHVQDSIQDQITLLRPCPAVNTSFDNLAKSLYTLSDDGKK